MRFKTSNLKEPKHSELVSCVSWASPDDVISIADDHKVENTINYFYIYILIAKADVPFV